MRLRGSFADAINWKPFDVRYDALLKRWREHTECMDIEMRLSANVEQMHSSQRLEEMLHELEKSQSARSQKAAESESEHIGQFSFLN